MLRDLAPGAGGQPEADTNRAHLAARSCSPIPRSCAKQPSRLRVDFLRELDQARPGTAARLLVLVGDQQCAWRAVETVWRLQHSRWRTAGSSPVLAGAGRPVSARVAAMYSETRTVHNLVDQPPPGIPVPPPGETSCITVSTRVPSRPALQRRLA